MKNVFKNGLIYLIFLGIFFGNFLLAAELVWPRPPGGQPLDPDSSTLPDLIRYFYQWGISLGGLAAFIALVIAGIRYLTSFGNPAAMKEAMDGVKSAFFGLAFLLASWLILNTISPQFTTFEELRLEIRPESFPLLPTAIGPAPSRPCDFVELYREKNWQGNYVKWELDKIGTRGNVGFAPLSVRQWREVGEDEICKPEGINPETGEMQFSGIAAELMATNPEAWKTCEDVPQTEIFRALERKYETEPGDPSPVMYTDNKWFVADGDCTIQLHTGGWFFGWGCGERKAEVSASDKDLSRWTDEEIKCWKVVSASRHERIR